MVQIHQGSQTIILNILTSARKVTMRVYTTSESLHALSDYRKRQRQRFGKLDSCRRKIREVITEYGNTRRTEQSNGDQTIDRQLIEQPKIECTLKIPKILERDMRRVEPHSFILFKSARTVCNTISRSKFVNITIKLLPSFLLPVTISYLDLRLDNAN